MKRRLVRFDDGSTAYLLQMDDVWLCPVCGSAEFKSPPYDEDGAASFQRCGFCHFEFGYDDAFGKPVKGAIANWNNWRERLIEGKRLTKDAWPERWNSFRQQLARIGRRLEMSVMNGLSVEGPQTDIDRGVVFKLFLDAGFGKEAAETVVDEITHGQGYFITSEDGKELERLAALLQAAGVRISAGQAEDARRELTGETQTGLHSPDTVLEIRPAIESDARAIARVHVQTWQAAYRGIVPDSYLDSLSVDKREILWRQTLARAEPEVWVAELRTGVAGWVAFGPSRDADGLPGTGELEAIYVTPAEWSTGIGRELWRVARRRLIERGFTSATVRVLSDNARAIRFYHAAGFQPAGSEKEIDLGGKPLRELRYAVSFG